MMFSTKVSLSTMAAWSCGSVGFGPAYGDRLVRGSGARLVGVEVGTVFVGSLGVL